MQPIEPRQEVSTVRAVLSSPHLPSKHASFLGVVSLIGGLNRSSSGVCSVFPHNQPQVLCSSRNSLSLPVWAPWVAASLDAYVLWPVPASVEGTWLEGTEIHQNHHPKQFPRVTGFSLRNRRVWLLELPWWSSGWDSVPPMQGTLWFNQVQSLIRELDPTCPS